MRKEISKPFRFVLYFAAVSAVLLFFWKIIHLFYLRLLVFTGNPVWKLMDFPVRMDITGDQLHFIYRFVLRDPLSFTVYDADEIYLNLIILIALIGATRFSTGMRVMKPASVASCALFVIHFILLTAYAYTHIWTFTKAQEADAGRELLRHVSPLFSERVAGYLDSVLFHWNTWGWDVIPLLIWAAALYIFRDYRKGIDDYLRALPKKKHIPG
jgi:hypothetical protein